ncbi:MAG: aldehyde:ferredoxin oxidoreductase [Deltaproteobacteria bacterium RBG_13_47_9]|nr:MAG: aldehyde:ferredoxin oxidoreductase [Deltaproteobacteria bacterium RBG_13_47_9]
MKGLFNKILRIDLKTKAFRGETISDSVFHQYLGGKGLGVYLLMKENPPGVDPLSPQNKLIFCLGPVSDTRIYGSCRHGAFTKSPLTGIFSESYSGGKAAEPMSRTGYDAFILEEASNEPIWIEISDQTVIFYDAQNLWGKDTYFTEDEVLRKMNQRGAATLVIGPAGENLIRFSVIENDYWRSLGRTGVGAVMGSKKVKAIAFHGERRREVAYPDRLERFAKETLERGKDSPGAQAYRRLGTPMLVAMNNAVGGFPSKYWHLGTFEGWEKISAESLIERCHVKPTACLRCFVACGNLSEMKEGRHKGLRIEGPEYETIYAFGGLCMVHEIEEIAYLNDICDRLGMDTISAGSLCAFAIEASEMGRIREKLRWGDVDKIAELLHDIAYKKRLGAILSEGIRHAAKVWQMEDIAIHVNGMDPAGYDPRVQKGMGLAYATSDRGACHLRATFYKAELSGMIPSNQVEGKARLFLEFEDRFNIHDALILCRFYRDLYWDWNYLSTIVEVTTGLKLDEGQLRKISSNIQNATRRFNLREGISSKGDILPKRFFDEPLGKEGKVIRREDLHKMLQDYYELRGWSPEGVP